MGLREDALRRILSLDAGRSAQLSLRLAQDQVQARAGAVLAVDQGRYVLFAATELDRQDLGRIASAWDEHGGALLAGRPVVNGDSMVVPVGRPLKGLLYLGGARRTPSAEIARQITFELDELLQISLSLRGEEPEARTLYETMIEHVPLRQLERQKLLLVLRANEWNKSRTAQVLGVTRPTLYKWMRRHGLDGDEAG